MVRKRTKRFVGAEIGVESIEDLDLLARFSERPGSAMIREAIELYLATKAEELGTLHKLIGDASESEIDSILRHERIRRQLEGVSKVRPTAPSVSTKPEEDE